MNRGNSDFVLFTDADVNFKEGIFKRVMAYCTASRLDHFTLLPDPVTDSFLLKTVFQAFGFVLITATRAYNVGKKDKKEYVGCGAFNLVRKSVFEHSEGFDWLKMEVADDVGLGLLMKNAEGKNDFAVTFSEISLGWYSSLSDMFNGLEKNFYGVAADYSFLKMMWIVAEDVQMMDSVELVVIQMLMEIVQLTFV